MTYRKCRGHGHIIQQRLVQPLCSFSPLVALESHGHARRTLGIQSGFLLSCPFLQSFAQLGIRRSLFENTVDLMKRVVAESIVQECTNFTSDGRVTVWSLFGADLCRVGWKGRSIGRDEGRNVAQCWSWVFRDLADNVGDRIGVDIVCCNTQFTIRQRKDPVFFLAKHESGVETYYAARPKTC